MSADAPAQQSEAQSVKSAWSAVLRRRASARAIAQAHRIRTQSVVSESVAVDAAPVPADLIPDGVVPSSLAAIRRHNAAARAGLASASSATSASPETAGGAS